MLRKALLGKTLDPVSVLMRMAIHREQDIPADLDGHIALVDERNRYLLDEQSNYLVEE